MPVAGVLGMRLREDWRTSGPPAIATSAFAAPASNVASASVDDIARKLKPPCRMARVNGVSAKLAAAVAPLGPAPSTSCSSAAAPVRVRCPTQRMACARRVHSTMRCRQSMRRESDWRSRRSLNGCRGAG